MSSKGRLLKHQPRVDPILRRWSRRGVDQHQVKIAAQCLGALVNARERLLERLGVLYEQLAEALWRRTGSRAECPHGTESKRRAAFSQEEWAAFGVGEVRRDHYIATRGDVFYKPAVAVSKLADMAWACRQQVECKAKDKV